MKSIATTRVVSAGGNYRHHITTGHGHSISADEPAALGGQNAGPAPYELLLSALGACTAITLRMYAEKKGWDIGAFQVALDLQKNREGETRIERTLTSDALLGDEQWERLLAVAEKTPVTLTLKQGAPITTTRG